MQIDISNALNNKVWLELCCFEVSALKVTSLIWLWSLVSWLLASGFFFFTEECFAPSPMRSIERGAASAKHSSVASSLSGPSGRIGASTLKCIFQPLTQHSSRPRPYQAKALDMYLEHVVKKLSIPWLLNLQPPAQCFAWGRVQSTLP